MNTYLPLLEHAIRRRLTTDSDLRSFTIRAHPDDAECILVGLQDRSYTVKPRSLEHAATSDTWYSLAGGVLRRLRQRHSVTEPAVFAYDQVLEQVLHALKTVLSLAVPADHFNDIIAGMELDTEPLTANARLAASIDYLQSTIVDLISAEKETHV